MLDAAQISFDGIEWQSAGDGARQKVTEHLGQPVRLVELTDAFVHDGWCTKGHDILVLEGVLEMTFDDRVECFAAGASVTVATGERDRHRPRAQGASVRLIVIDDPSS